MSGGENKDSMYQYHSNMRITACVQNPKANGVKMAKIFEVIESLGYVRIVTRKIQCLVAVCPYSIIQDDGPQ